jgi:iron complex outermembrane receptor protein
MREDWEIFLSYSVFEVAAASSNENYLRGVPRNQIYLQSSWDYDGNKQFDLIGRYTDSLALGVPKYFEMDARWGWQMTDTLELSFFGRNLLDSHHLEFTADPYVVPTEVRRSWYAMLTWTY